MQSESASQPAVFFNEKKKCKIKNSQTPPPDDKAYKFYYRFSPYLPLLSSPPARLQMLKNML
jgi:hypothetical protein